MYVCMYIYIYNVCILYIKHIDIICSIYMYMYRLIKVSQRKNIFLKYFGYCLLLLIFSDNNLSH